MRLEGKSTIVTGANGGIGRAVARRFLKNYENNGPGWDFGERDASLVS